MADKLWVEQYIRELEKEERRQILEQAIAEEGMTEENSLRKQLLDQRYEMGKNGMLIDHFIRGWMGIAYMRNEGSGVFAKKRIEKEKDKIRKDLMTDFGKEHGDLGQEVLYGEYYNLAKLYIHLCKEDRTYGAVLLGLGRMKTSKLIQKIANEILLVGYQMPETLGMEDELRTFRNAITDAFCDEHSKEKHMLMDLIRAGK